MKGVIRMTDNEKKIDKIIDLLRKIIKKIK